MLRDQLAGVKFHSFKLRASGLTGYRKAWAVNSEGVDSKLCVRGRVDCANRPSVRVSGPRAHSMLDSIHVTMDES